VNLELADCFVPHFQDEHPVPRRIRGRASFIVRQNGLIIGKRIVSEIWVEGEIAYLRLVWDAT
jgi:hypothetical protein